MSHHQNKYSGACFGGFYANSGNWRLERIQGKGLESYEPQQHDFLETAETYTWPV